MVTDISTTTTTTTTTTSNEPRLHLGLARITLTIATKNAGDELWDKMKKTLLLVFIHGFKVRREHSPTPRAALIAFPYTKMCRAATTLLQTFPRTFASSLRTLCPKSTLSRSNTQSSKLGAIYTNVYLDSKNGIIHSFITL
jgi:hypothetical protein